MNWFSFLLGIVVSGTICGVSSYLRDGLYWLKVKQWLYQKSNSVDNPEIKKVYEELIKELDGIE